MGISTGAWRNSSSDALPGMPGPVSVTVGAACVKSFAIFRIARARANSACIGWQVARAHAPCPVSGVVGTGNAIKCTDVEEVRVSVKAASGHFIRPRGFLQQRKGAAMCSARPPQEPCRGAHVSHHLERAQSDWGIVRRGKSQVSDMDSIIYLVSLIVVVMFILSLLGLH